MLTTINTLHIIRVVTINTLHIISSRICWLRLTLYILYRVVVKTLIIETEKMKQVTIFFLDMASCTNLQFHIMTNPDSFWVMLTLILLYFSFRLLSNTFVRFKYCKYILTCSFPTLNELIPIIQDYFNRALKHFAKDDTILWGLTFERKNSRNGNLTIVNAIIINYIIITIYW